MDGSSGARGRRPLAVGAVVVLLTGLAGGSAPAQAAAGARATAVQTVTVATVRIVVQAGTQPALTGAPAMQLVSLLGPQYAVVTNLGTVQPSKVVYTTAGLTVLPTVTVCTQPWTVPALSPPSCADGGPGAGGGRTLTLNKDTTDATLVPPVAKTWYLMISGVAAVGTLLATASLPLATVTSS